MKASLPTIKVAAVSTSRVASAPPVAISSRRNVLSAGVLGAVLFQFSRDEASANNKEEVAARKERLGKKEAPQEAEAAASENKNASKTTNLLSAREKRLAGLREKAARIRSGEAPTF